MRKTISLSAAALVGAAALVALPPTPSVGGVTSVGIHGTAFDGSWDYNYGGSAGNGDVHLEWRSWQQADGDTYVQYQGRVSTAGNWLQANGHQCLYVAFDWAIDGHEDRQIIRNCDNASDVTMEMQTHNVDKYCPQVCFIGTEARWPIRAMQIGTYRNDMGQVDEAVFDRFCPSVIITGTDTNSSCADFHPNGQFAGFGAKIRSRGPGGPTVQNNPPYPGYDVRNIVDPNS